MGADGASYGLLGVRFGGLESVKVGLLQLLCIFLGHCCSHALAASPRPQPTPWDKQVSGKSHRLCLWLGRCSQQLSEEFSYSCRNARGAAAFNTLYPEHTALEHSAFKKRMATDCTHQLPARNVEEETGCGWADVPR
jgi:hypothetical protein